MQFPRCSVADLPILQLASCQNFLRIGAEGLQTRLPAFSKAKIDELWKDKRKSQMSNSNLQSLSFLERKEYEELKQANSAEARRKKERIVFLGFFAISLIATLLISGAMKLF